MTRRTFLWTLPLVALVPAVAAAQDDASSQSQPDPQMKVVLDKLAELGVKPIPTLTPEQARRQPTVADAVKAVLKDRGESTAPLPVGGVRDMSIPGPAGAIAARVYTPQGNGPFPVVAYWHGGGWVIADIDTYDASARALCRNVGAVVVSCHYRQAPEHPFPAAEEDAFAAYLWVLANAASLGGDPQRVAVAGESAGGNLAAAVCLRARDEDIRLPVHQLLVYPVTGHDDDTPSYQAHADAKPLDKPMMEWFWGHYLPDASMADNAYAVPLKSASFTNLPPATVVTAGIDPLMSEGKTYADRLEDAGIDVAYRNFEGVTHEFFGTYAVVDQARRAIDFAAERLKAAFGN